MGVGLRLGRARFVEESVEAIYAAQAKFQMLNEGSQVQIDDMTP